MAFTFRSKDDQSWKESSPTSTTSAAQSDWTARLHCQTGGQGLYCVTSHPSPKEP